MHETIYMSLFVQSRGALRQELAHDLRRGRVDRRPRGYSRMNGQGQLRDIVHISERPAEAEDRAVPGHWEGDLLLGSAQRLHRRRWSNAVAVRDAGQIPGRRTSTEVVRRAGRRRSRRCPTSCSGR